MCVLRCSYSFEIMRHRNPNTLALFLRSFQDCLGIRGRRGCTIGGESAEQPHSVTLAVYDIVTQRVQWMMPRTHPLPRHGCCPPAPSPEPPIRTLLTARHLVEGEFLWAIFGPQTFRSQKHPIQAQACPWPSPRAFGDSCSRPPPRHISCCGAQDRSLSCRGAGGVGARH